MKKWIKNLTVLFFVLAVTVAGGVCNSQAAGFGRGHHSGDTLKMISSLSLSQTEKTALMSALSSNGPAVKAAWQTLRTAQKTLKADLNVATPVPLTVGNDLIAVAQAKAALKTVRGTLDSALLNALSQQNQAALQTALTAQFNSRLNAEMGSVLFGYARYLQKQQNSAE